MRGFPPILHDCAVTEVHLQTEHLGWHTDDFLVVGQNGSGNNRKLVGQVKRTFTVSANNDECKKAVQDFWNDFKNPQQFSPSLDRFALVTLRGTNGLLEYFSGLLDYSRAARDGAEFERRLATPGFISTKAVRYCEEIRTIIGESEGRNISVAEVWPFLRVLHVLSLDLNSATRQAETTIKTLLAYTTSEQDALGAAESSWNALLRAVGDGMPESHSFRRDDLPEELRQRHSPVGGKEQRVLRAISDHSSLILNRIRSTIGNDIHLDRNAPVQQILQQLESTQVVLVSGPAGSGKSGIAKDAVGILAADHFVFGFRAEEFAVPHFDETLQNSQIPANGTMLGAVLSGQARKVLLIESVERLLEKSTRDAFADLLTLVAKDQSWRLVLTCRDYSTDLVRTGFFESATIGHSVVVVPPLADAELEEVKAAYPALARPLASPPLRQLLSNPYFLDRALQIPWSEDCPLPQNERELRALFWQDIVRADHHVAGGMPRRREEAFVQVALRRAQSLTQYASCSDLDAEVINALQHDSLIVSSSESVVLMAPAHDVLEDWAILQWIDEQHAIHQGAARDLCVVIGTCPAIRRTYRKWLSELVEKDATAADRLFEAAVRQNDLTAQFSDDTLVSLLRSPTSPAFLERHSTELFANNKQVLRRIIHLLRVACVTTPIWLKTVATHASLFNVPDSPAWACVLRLVQTNLLSFSHEDCTLLLAFIEDWAQGISWQTPYPEGADAAAVIAHWLLPHFDDYRSDDQWKRTLRVIAKIPNADRERFVALLEGDQKDEKRDRTARDFREIIFEGLEGMQAARDVPETIVAVAKRYLLCSEADLRQDRHFGSDLVEMETLFGIRHGRSHGFFPASAYYGPFLPLLRYHHIVGIALFIEVFNHSAEWYARPRVRYEYVEPPFEITLTFADGTSRTQWCNVILWDMYRGMTAGPYVLQSLLMALERWLLEIAEANPNSLDEVLLRILQNSNSAAITAVVASAATAFPYLSVETLLVLLQSQVCILMDRQRLASDQQAPSLMFGTMPRLNNGNQVYEAERKNADSLMHRHRDLEYAIFQLQFGAAASRVHELLDRHRTEMPPLDKQTEQDRVWRLALNRMDLREHTATEGVIPDTVADKEHAMSVEGKRYVRYDLELREPDLKNMVDESAQKQQVMNTSIGLLMWGLKIFGRETDAAYDSTQWQSMLRSARAELLSDHGDEESYLGECGPGFVAAVCVRDHWEEMGGEEQEWCVNVICSEVNRRANQWNQDERLQRNTISADRPCAWALSLLVSKTLSAADLHEQVMRMLVIAMTHANDEVRWYAAFGISENLWSSNRDFVLRCINVLATEATLIEQSRKAEDDQNFQERKPIDQIAAEAAIQIRERFFDGGGIADNAYEAMDTTTWFGAKANGRILAILLRAANDPIAVRGFGRLAHTLVTWWKEDDDRRRNREYRHRRERDHRVDTTLSDLFQKFVLRTSLESATTIIQPIVNAVDLYPQEIHWILLGLITAEDCQPNTGQFWELWELFADSIRHAEWLSEIDNEHPSGGEMISAIFLGTYWKEDVYYWRSLDGHAWRVHKLFEDLPASSTILRDYLRFLRYIGMPFLPEAFIRIADRIKSGNPIHLLQDGNTVFMLEILLQRYVYGNPLELKRRNNLREAVLFLLDVLVDRGSSAAFRMRDDFVTPISIT